MNRLSSSLIIIVSCLCFCIMSIYYKSSKIVLNIDAPDIFKIDLNNNKIIDDNETICLPNTQTFNSDSIPPEFAQNLDIQEIIKMHYMAEEFTKNILFLKPVKVNFTGDSDQNCRYANINIDHSDFGSKLVNAGFAQVNGVINQEAYENNLEKAKKLKLVILNHKSYKYHNLDCEYGRLSHDYTVVQEKQLPSDAIPCKFCHVNKKYDLKQKNSIPKLNLTSGDIKIILPDFTKKLKPDTSCTTDACKELLNDINSVKTSIDMAIYGYGNVPDIYNALLNAKKRNVKIRLVYDKHTEPEKDYYPDTQKIVEIADISRSDFYKGSTANTNKLMHNKFIVFDSKKVFTGSLNISPTDLSDFNANTVLVIDSQDVAKEYTKEFEQMLSGKFHNDKKKINPHKHYSLSNTNVELMFSPYDNTAKRIIDIINNANNYIYIPAFLITHHDISNALVKAKQRGVEIKIILDATSINTRNTKYDFLRKNGVQVKTEIFAGKMHSKTMIIDDKYIIAGSMNFSNSGVNKNDENCLIIENSKLAKEYKKFFIYLWNKIPDKWLSQNARAEGPESIGSCSDGVDNDYDGKIDKQDKGCTSSLR